MKVRWTRPASADIEEIGIYIARENGTAAAKIATAILDHAEMLGKHPHLGRAGRIAGTRELVVAGTPFIVAYRVSDEEVQLLAVFHGARRWPDRLE
jgi:toxin ParE1/3/4